jgi:hypothetical protein
MDHSARVCIGPESGHLAGPALGPLSANSGHTARGIGAEPADAFLGQNVEGVSGWLQGSPGECEGRWMKDAGLTLFTDN